LETPALPKNPQITVAAVEPTTAAIARIASVVESDTAPAEILNQNLDEASFIGSVYSAVLTYQYMRMESDNRQRTASPKTRAAAEKEWPDVINAFRKAYAAAGLKNVDEPKMSGYAKGLATNKRNLDAIAKIVNSAKVIESDVALPPAIRGSFVPVVAKIIGPAASAVTTIPNLCAVPFAQGSFTKHFSYSFSLGVSFNAPCFPKVWKMCSYHLTIASVSFSANLNVGYKVNCCGASAWGQGSVQACGSILGHSACASCSATIVGVAGVSRTTGSGGSCNYGLGINASLVCKVGSSTVFSASAPFGYTIAGPCPPAVLPC
jgi:hypothetical protein